MNIAVINIKDIIKSAIVLGIIVIAIISGIIIVKEKEELKMLDIKRENNSSFLYYLGMEFPLMGKEEEKKEEIEKGKENKLLNKQIAMLYSVEDEEEIEEIREEIFIGEEEGENKEEEVEEVENKKIDTAGGVDTKVINENNITASFTDEKSDIQIKNQSKYDVKEILENPNYELKNKNKVVIYHTHTCESYTPSDKYGYEMTGAYRTTDLNFSVAKVRR
ncbi:MAG: hypothetical protein HFJ50_06135 [Clostridia bacterium]|jgi:hypothetical protein|nr:hypothetical protein [Clostridia bacterium]